MVLCEIRSRCTYRNAIAMRLPDPYVGHQTPDGKYTILRKIGTGGMGAVYRAFQPDQNRLVAIKILRKDLVQKPALRSRFGREIKALLHLSHPNIVQVFDDGEMGDTTPYFVMEYLEGRNLNHEVRVSGRMDVEKAIPIIRRVCAGLEDAHRLGMVHRDLKPENIFLCHQDGVDDFPKILDFGLAKVTANERRAGTNALTVLTFDGMVYGTPEFMSPEQAQGKEVDLRGDIYALGLILYEVLTGSLPFDAKAPAEFIQHHVLTPPIPLGRRVSGLQFPAGLEDVLDKALQKNPGDRFQSVAEFSAALGLYVSPTDKSICPGSGPSELPPGNDAPTAPSPTTVSVWQRIQSSLGSWFSDGPENTPTQVSLPTPTELGEQRLGELRTSRVDALQILKDAVRMGAEADIVDNVRAARAMRRASAMDIIRAVERTYYERLTDVRASPAVAARWLSLLSNKDPRKKRDRPFGQARLEEFLSKGRLPSLSAIADLFVVSTPLDPMLENEVRQVLGLGQGLERDIARMGRLRNVLAHQSEYEAGQDEKNDPIDDGELYARIVLGTGIEIEVTAKTLVWLESLARNALERSGGANSFR